MKPWTLGPEYHYKRAGMAHSRCSVGDKWESASYYPLDAAGKLVGVEPVIQTERRDDADWLKTCGPARQPQSLVG